jgi:hypothetical protein
LGGIILQWNSTYEYYIYGDHYTNTNFINQLHGSAVYTSTDMQSWERRSEMMWHNNSKGVFPVGPCPALAPSR